MATKKVLVTLQEKEYPFSVEAHHTDQGKHYKATADAPFPAIDAFLDGPITFTEDGTPDKKPGNDQVREVTDAIWRAVKEQVINDHTTFDAPL